MIYTAIGYWVSILATVVILGMGTYWVYKLVQHLLCEYLLPFVQRLGRKIDAEKLGGTLFKIGPTFAASRSKNIGFWIIFTDVEKEAGL